MGANLILPAATPADDEVVTKSCRFDGAVDTYLRRDISTSAQSTKATFSWWMKVGDINSSNNQSHAILNTALQSYANTGNASGTANSNWAHIVLYNSRLVYGGWTGGSDFWNRQSKNLFRDPSAWYHCVISVENNGASSDAQLWVNGVEDSFDNTNTTPNTSVNLPWGLASNCIQVHRYGDSNSAEYWDVLLADVHLMIGKGPDDFSGHTNPAYAFAKEDANGQWVPKDTGFTSSDYGTHGFRLDFADSTDLGNEVSGNNNDFETLTGVTDHDQLNDRPTNNYAVLNPLTNTTGVLSEGNLDIDHNTSDKQVYGSIGVSSGKWYWEVKLGNDADGSRKNYLGISNTIGMGSNAARTGSAKYAYFAASQNSNYADSSATVDVNPGYGGNGDVYGFAFNADTGTLWVKKNGAPDVGVNTDRFVYGLSTSETWFPYNEGNDTSSESMFNFGQDPTFAGNKSGEATSEFFYTPPSGYNALSTANLADPTIKKPYKYFNTKLYTDGTGAKTFGEADAMQPDLVWVKSRGSGTDHKVTDSLRGVQKSLETNTTNAEVSEGANVGITSFDSDGFTVGSSSSTTGPYADQTDPDMVAWAWKEGATQGFDIVTWTGDSSTSGVGSEQTVSHSLSDAPDFIITKNRTNNYIGPEFFANVGWVCWHKDLSATGKYILLGTTGEAPQTYLISAIGSSSVKFGNDATPNYFLNAYSTGYSAGDDYVAYLFSEVAGYSKFGVFTGNASTDGPMIWCGFRPAFFIATQRNGGTWYMYDKERPAYNEVDICLAASASNSEAALTKPPIDFVSNGVKIRGSHSDFNASTEYIFAAFAESPFKYAAAR